MLLMQRGSKHNPYTCPVCGYKTTRKANLKTHLARMHDLAMSMEGQPSQKKWVWASRRTLIEKYAWADPETAGRMWLTTVPAFAKFGEKLGYFSYMSMMREALEERKKKQGNV